MAENRGGWVRQRCRVSYVTGASNLYWLIVGQGLLSLHQVGEEGECSYYAPAIFIGGGGGGGGRGGSI